MTYLTDEPLNSVEPDSDEVLAERMKSRDESALEILLKRHQPLLRTVINRVVHNEADVDDLISEVALEFWNRIDQYDLAKGKVLGWLVTMARRRSIDKVRRRQAYDRAEERLRLENEHVEPFYMFSIDSLSVDRSEHLRRLLNSSNIPAKQRQAAIMNWFEGISQRDISARLRVPLGTVKTRLELALKKVKRLAAMDPAFQECRFAID